MATAVLELKGYVIPLSREEYSCPEEDGLHDWGGFDRTICVCGTMHTYCTQCGEVYRDCDFVEYGVN